MEMRALQVTAHGRPGEVLAVRAVAVPEPAPGEVRVKVGAASLNFNDIDRCWGRLVSVPTPPPFTLGMDVCGVVDAAGAGAESWIGERVVAITKTALGGIAEYAIAPAVSVFEAPAQLDDAEAAGFVLSFQTSHLALFRRGRLRSGETLVVHAGASGLGTAGIQLGKAAGARVIAVDVYKRQASAVLVVLLWSPVALGVVGAAACLATFRFVHARWREAHRPAGHPVAGDRPLPAGAPVPAGADRR